MGAREEILDNVRKNQPCGRDLPAVPMFHREGRPVTETFAAALKTMAGETIERPPADLAEFLQRRFPAAKNICSAVPEFPGGMKPLDFPDWASPAAIDVTVVRSPLGVAETGSVLLSEKELGVNTIAFLAHDIVVLLDPKRIVENIHDAYAHPAFRDSNYAVLLTGPSGTADVGGIVVHPAQAVTTMTVIFWPES